MDTNIILRILLEDIEHPKYGLAVAYIEQNVIVPKYVLPEVICG